MGGDFNYDPWRNAERLMHGPPLTSLARHLESVIEDLTPDLTRWPTVRAFTYADQCSRSSLDHWFVSNSGTAVLECEAIKDSTCQHLPLRLYI
jgi:endonuclease/exonuclease/phosphatase family metal-dependent hydrolase